MAGEETLPELDGDLELQTEMDEGTTEVQCPMYHVY